MCKVQRWNNAGPIILLTIIIANNFTLGNSYTQHDRTLD